MYDFTYQRPASLEDAASALAAGEDATLLAGGHSAGATLHVGDHPEHDVHGAKQAGLPSVWVNRDGGSYPDALTPPDATVTDLAELDALLVRSEWS